MMNDGTRRGDVEYVGCAVCADNDLQECASGLGKAFGRRFQIWRQIKFDTAPKKSAEEHDESRMAIMSA